MRCLATTNVIESTHGGARQRIGRVKNWQDGVMALRWASAAFEATAQHFKRIMGHQSRRAGTQGVSGSVGREGKSWRAEESRVNHEPQAATEPSTTGGTTSH
jgi:hypothetical protein